MEEDCSRLRILDYEELVEERRRITDILLAIEHAKAAIRLARRESMNNHALKHLAVAYHLLGRGSELRQLTDDREYVEVAKLRQGLATKKLIIKLAYRVMRMALKELRRQGLRAGQLVEPKGYNRGLTVVDT
ncbi:MAG: hypothetical protein ABWW69_00595 [Pyrodictiaceae archaeon]